MTRGFLRSERTLAYSAHFCGSSPCSAEGRVKHASLWLWRSRNVSPPFRYPRRVTHTDAKLVKKNGRFCLSRTINTIILSVSQHSHMVMTPTTGASVSLSATTCLEQHPLQSRWERRSRGSAGRMHSRSGCRSRLPRQIQSQQIDAETKESGSITKHLVSD